jgi:hypothetical protein
MSRLRLVINSKYGSLEKLLDGQARKSVMPHIRRSVGSEHRNGGREVIRGLPPELEEVIMPRELGISRNTPDYDKQVRTFWVEFGIKLRGDSYLELDMSTTKQKHMVNGVEKELDFPVNVREYMMGYFAKQSSQVACTKEQKENMSLYPFILVDVEEDKKEQLTAIDVETKAIEHYLALIKNIDSDTVEAVLEIFRSSKELHIRTGMSSSDKKIVLSKIKDLYPKRLTALCKDKNLGLKAEINRALRAGVLKLEGDTYFIDGDDIPIARSKDEMVAAFNDPAKTRQIATIRAKLEQTK